NWTCCIEGQRVPGRVRVLRQAREPEAPGACPAAEAPSCPPGLDTQRPGRVKYTATTAAVCHPPVGRPPRAAPVLRRDQERPLPGRPPGCRPPRGASWFL